MKGIGQFLSEKLLPIAGKVGSNKCLVAVRDGIMLAMPLVIIGSLLMILATGFSIPQLKALMSEAGIDTYLMKGSTGSFGLIGLLASFGIAHSFAKQYRVDGVCAGIISFSCFIVVTPLIASGDEAGVPVKFLAANGLFIAIVMGLVNGYVYQWFINHGIEITMPESVPPAVSKSFSAILPGACLVVGWLMIYIILDKFHLPNLHLIAKTVLGAPLGLLGNNLPGVAITVLLNSLLWFVGLHGGAIVNQMMTPVWLANLNENAEALKAGAPLKHIFTAPFADHFVFMGGCGATIGLVIALIWYAKKKRSSKQSRTLVPLTLVPSLFSVNEPVTFGIPVVLNVLLLIPFVLAPLLNLLIAYIAMVSGLVPLTHAIPGWTTPPIISGYLATGSVNAALLQVVLIVLDALLYLPFVKTLERRFKLEEKASDTVKKASDTVKKASDTEEKASDTVKKASDTVKKASDTVKKASDTEEKADSY